MLTIPKWMRYTAVAGCMAGILAVTGCGSDETAAPKAPMVRTLVIGNATTGQNGGYAGVVKNRTETTLSFQVAGRVHTKKMVLGQHVHAGEVLATLEQSDMSDQVTRAEGSLAAAQSQYELAMANVARYRTLYQEQAISRLQLDQMENTFKVAQAQLSQAQAAVNLSKNQLGYTVLTAPGDGVITAVNITDGQVVGAGQPVGSIAVGDSPEIIIHVPEQAVSQLQPGTKGTATFWSLPNVKTEAIVSEIAPAPDPASRAYEVKLTLPQAPQGLQLGMTANVTFTGMQTQAIVVPLTAIISGNPSANGDAAVYVVRDNKAVKVDVKTGPLMQNGVAILQGLKQGDRIITAGTNKLKPNEAVRYEE